MKGEIKNKRKKRKKGVEDNKTKGRKGKTSH
jgi:hypothetical protein